MENNFIDKSDAKLVAGSLQDPEFFAFLVERYEKQIDNYIRHLFGFSKEDREDLLQAIFLKCYLNLNGFNPELKFSSWLYRLARNESINFYHHQKARPQVDKFFISRDLPDASFINLLKEIDIDLEIERLKNIISLLGSREKEILYLYFWEEKNYREIADILKCPLGTVSASLSRSKKKIKNKYYEKFSRYNCRED